MSHLYKHIICNVLLLMLAATVITGCQKEDNNGDLGGFWKLTKITNTDGDIINKTDENRFWRIQLELIQISKSYGRFQYTGDSLFIQMIETNNGALIDYGIYNAENERFAVEHLDRNKMILQSKNARLNLKKF